MSKYDCSKLLDFVHEMNRMCDEINDCRNCSLYELTNCGDMNNFTQKHIDAIQKWSDTHPEKSKKDEVNQRNDAELLSTVISKICNYAVDNNLSPDESLRAVSKQILAMLNVASFESWKSEDKSKAEDKE